MANSEDVLERARDYTVTMGDHWKNGEVHDLVCDLAAEVRELRRDRARLEAAVAAVASIHSPDHTYDGWHFCTECNDDYQCRTAQAIDAAMGGGEGEA